MITTPWSENSPHQGITFPHGRSTGVENGLNILGWETWVYELGPLRGQAHSLHSSGWGWNIEPPAWDRRSLLKGSSRGGPLRRDNISGNHTLASHRGAMRSSKTRSRRTISRTPGSRVIGGNAYRRSHAHVCTITSSPIGAGCMWEKRSGQWDVSRDTNRSTCAWPNSLHISSTTSGWSLHSPGLSPCLDRMSAPILWTPWDVSCSKRQQLPLGPQEDLACQFATWTWPQTPLVIYVEDHWCVVWLDEHKVAPAIC